MVWVGRKPAKRGRTTLYCQNKRIIVTDGRTEPGPSLPPRRHGVPGLDLYGP